jgi:hypothetical protein
MPTYNKDLGVRHTLHFLETLYVQVDGLQVNVRNDTTHLIINNDPHVPSSASAEVSEMNYSEASTAC